MPKKNIAVIGGGFAGISALRRLTRCRKTLPPDFEVVLIDRKDCSEFLPLLPDVAGGWMRPEPLSTDLRPLAESRGSGFIRDEVTEVDLKKKKITLAGGSLDYEFLLICPGSETNFFGSAQARDNCFKLDCVADALRIQDTLSARAVAASRLNVVVVGGGYTGIEIATNIRFLLTGQKADFHVSIVEKAPEILMMVPAWMRAEVRRELAALDVELALNDSLRSYDGRTAALESGRKIENAFCVWAAGVKTPPFVEKLAVEKERTRIKVTQDLRIGGWEDAGVFVAGDAASFHDRKSGAPIRMAVMFSIGQGVVAARNIAAGILHRPLSEYRPVDLGYLIPMAHGRACGPVVGIKARGFAGYLMHYYMCIYRSESRNRPEIVKDFLRKRAVKQKEEVK